MPSSDISGKAYGFLDYKGPKSDLELELQDIRLGDFPIPQSLEISVTEIRKMNGDLELFNLALEALSSGMTYVVEATYPNFNNRMAALELSNIFIYLSQSPIGRGANKSAIIYDNGGYNFLG